MQLTFTDQPTDRSARQPDGARRRAAGPAESFLLAVCVAAASAPALIAYNLPPSATFFNQAAALFGWGLVAALIGVMVSRVRSSEGGPMWPAPSGLVTIVLALVLVIVSAVLSTTHGSLPRSLALSSIGMVAAALVMIWAGVAARRAGAFQAVFDSFCVAWVVAGLCCVAIALIETFMPEMATGTFIAPPAWTGAASGNLRQTNHMSTLIVWAAASTVWLLEARIVKLRVAALLMALFVFTVVLTASRTGVLQVLALAVWGLLDRRLSRHARMLLVACPLIYLVGWFGFDEWAKSGSRVFAGATKLEQADITGSRFAVWSNAIELIRMSPWLGTGFGEFNFAWTLTEFPKRPTEFFDHPHNLLLHLASELGLPLAVAITALLSWTLWKAFAASRQGLPLEATATRTAFVMLFLVAIHSQLEYPLWYAYFLLPAALMFGLCVGGEPAPRDVSAPRRAGGSPALVAAATLMMAGTFFAITDYRRVVVIFAPPETAGSLEDRIADGQRSRLFAYHADYAAVTNQQHDLGDVPAWNGAVNYLLDTRLMMSWAEALARGGDLQRARYLADRMREFRNPDLAPFFAVCDAFAAQSKALQTPPAGAVAASSTSRESVASGGQKRINVTLAPPHQQPPRSQLRPQLPAQLQPPPPFQCVPLTSKFTYRDFIVR